MKNLLQMDFKASAKSLLDNAAARPEDFCVFFVILILWWPGDECYFI